MLGNLDIMLQICLILAMLKTPDELKEVFFKDCFSLLEQFVVSNEADFYLNIIYVYDGSYHNLVPGLKNTFKKIISKKSHLIRDPLRAKTQSDFTSIEKNISLSCPAMLH